MSGISVYKIYQRLFQRYGPQNWWPASSRFEVMVGAILTQNTSWTNVERAIISLKRERVLSCNKLANMPHAQLAQLLTPVGYFNVKAHRLQHFWYDEQGGYRKLSAFETDKLRHALLGVHGVGPETADDILLYAFERPVFVIDAYTRRLFSRLGMAEDNVNYETLRQWFEQRLSRCKDRVTVFNEYHALIVLHAKQVCLARQPRCESCTLQRYCDYGD